MRPVFLLVSVFGVLIASTLSAAETLVNKVKFGTTPSGERYAGLQVAGQPITDRQLATLPVIPAVRYLNLHGTRITNEGVRHFVQKFPNLEVVYLNKTAVGDDGLAHLGTLPKLRSLYLRECVRVTNAGLAHLKNLPLGQLDIQATKVTDEGLEHVADWWPNLGWLAVPQGVTDAGMAHIAKCQQLVVLDLAVARITNEGLAEVTKLQNLRRLKLPILPWKMDAEGVLQLKSLPSLHTLEIVTGLIRKDTLDDLLEFPALVRVELGGSHGAVDFTNADLQVFWKQLKEKRARLQVSVVTEK